MATRKGEAGGKEVTSFSVRPGTLEVLEKYLTIMESTQSRSVFVDEAIREKLTRELFNNPIAWRKLFQIIEELSS